MRQQPRGDSRGILHPGRLLRQVRFRRHLPAPALRPWVEHYWFVDWDLTEPLGTGGRYAELSLQYIMGIIFAPLAWLMGIDYGQLMMSGQIIGEKTVLNEFYAYGTLANLKNSGALTDPRTQIILTYALCGFSNIASIGIQIGGIGALAPNQRSTLAQLGLKALLGGSIACFLTACVASMIIP
jgi:CNT family concentrative nucleoside transporter